MLPGAETALLRPWFVLWRIDRQENQSKLRPLPSQPSPIPVKLILSGKRLGLYLYAERTEPAVADQEIEPIMWCDEYFALHGPSVTRPR
jgi:hypothetical protein